MQLGTARCFPPEAEAVVEDSPVLAAPAGRITGRSSSGVSCLVTWAAVRYVARQVVCQADCAALYTGLQ